MGKKGKKPREENYFSDFVITHHGTDSVTGTCIQLDIPKEELCILLDLGFYQDSTKTVKEQFDINRKKCDVLFEKVTHVLISHSHLDHVGGLGLLMLPESNFTGKIMCTEATQQLAYLNVRDCAFVMAQQCKMYNKANPSKKPLLPLYLEEHANELILHMQGYMYDEVINLTPNVSVQFLSTGHMLGAASILITYKVDEYTTRRLLYTGDTDAYTNNPKPFTKVWNYEDLDIDVLIMENTYSGRFHEKINVTERLEEIVLEHCLKNRGILFIPAFAIARSSQMVYYLKQVWDRNKELQKNNIPIYFVGLLANESHKRFANDYYMKNYMDAQWRDTDCFKWGNVHRLEKFSELDEKLMDNKPKIVIASSGMLTGGFSTYIAQMYLGRPNVATLFCGYQGNGTHGRAVLDTRDKDKKTVNIQGREYNVRCQIPEPITMSGHADEAQLLKLVKSLNQNKLKHIILIHGDTEMKQHMKERLEQVLDMDKKTVHIPQVEQNIRLFNNRN